MNPRRLLTVAFALLSLAGFTFATSASADVVKLPKKFVWGVASSGFQSEGYTTRNNWNYYIKRDSGPNPADKPKEAYGNSVDFYHRYPEDIKLAAKLGVNTYRISINWARVEPRPGKFSQKGLRFYDRVFKTMAKYDIKPLITLNHWDYPMWVYKQGGWTSRKTVKDFLGMTKVVAKRYGSYARYWITFNEEFFLEFIEGGAYPLTDEQVATMRANMITAHRRAYDILHRYDPDAQVSTNYAWPGRGALASIETDPFMTAVADKLDYVALDYYYPAYNQLASLIQLTAGTSWLIPDDPFGMYTALQSMHAQFPKLPVMISENGMGTENGETRPDGVTRSQLMQDTLYWAQRAKQDGVPLMGYVYWSLTDNYEWGSYTPRFGLYTVDVKNDPKLKRRPTAAVKTYRGLIDSRGVKPGYQLVQKPDATNCSSPSVRTEDQTACLAAANP